jgi:hypothetical protein
MTPKPQHDIIEEFESISDNFSRGEATPQYEHVKSDNKGWNINFENKLEEKTEIN